jgi:hypothetical protein
MIMQQLQTDCVAHANRLQSVNGMIKHRLRGKCEPIACEAIARRLQGNCMVNMQQLQTDCEAIAKRSQETIARRLRTDCEALAR